MAEHTTAYVRERLPKIYSRELVDVIFNQPYCRIQNVVDLVGVTRQTGARHLKELVEIGAGIDRPVRQRSTTYGAVDPR